MWAAMNFISFLYSTIVILKWLMNEVCLDWLGSYSKNILHGANYKNKDRIIKVKQEINNMIYIK